jgi:hypothetical protein
MMHTLTTLQLEEIIQNKLHILEQLWQLCQQQQQWILESHWERLLHVLAAKEQLLRQLQSVERRLDPFRHEDPESRVWSSPEARARCRQMVQRCESLLAEILSWERQGEQELLRRRDAIAAQLEALDRHASACRAYLPVHEQAVCGQQLDLTSER